MQLASPDRDRIVVIAGGNHDHDPDQLLAALDELDPTVVIRSKLSGANATAFGWTKARDREMHDIPDGEIVAHLADLASQSSVVIVDLTSAGDEAVMAIVQEAQTLGVPIVRP